MKYISIIAICVLCAGCDLPKTRVWRTVPTTPEERAACERMIVELCSVSNPYSDEEPEDMIIQAQKTAFDTICKPTEWWWNPNSHSYEPINLPK